MRSLKHFECWGKNTFQFCCVNDLLYVLLSFEWNSIRLGGPVHGIVTKTVHKTLPGGGRGEGGMGWVGEVYRGSRGLGMVVVGSKGGGGVGVQG